MIYFVVQVDIGQSSLGLSTCYSHLLTIELFKHFLNYYFSEWLSSWLSYQLNLPFPKPFKRNALR